MTQFYPASVASSLKHLFSLEPSSQTSSPIYTRLKVLTESKRMTSVFWDVILLPNEKASYPVKG